jgi:hypothetical protein
MAWTLWGLAVQTIAGFFGAQANASAAHEHRFGFIGHSLAGIVGGAFSGLFLQQAAATLVTGSGSLNSPTRVDLAVIYALTGAVAGAILMFAVGFVVNSLRRKG